MRAAGFLIAIALGGCGKDEKKPGEQPSSGAPAAKASEPAKDRGNYRDSIAGLEIEVPPDAEPMNIPGYQTPDKSFAVVVQSLGPELEHKDPAAFKASIKYGLKDWLKEETFEDGWYVTNTTDMGGPPGYSLQMRRKIDGTWYKCTCILPKEDRLEEVIKACKSLRKKA